MSHVDEGVLHAYLDGALPPDERREADAHLAGCEICRARLDEERALRARASDLLGLAVPPETAAPRTGLPPRRRPRYFVPVAWAATLALAVGLGWLIRGGGTAPPARLAEPSPSDVAVTTLPAPAAAKPAPQQSPGARQSETDRLDVAHAERDSVGPPAATLKTAAPEPRAAAAPEAASGAGVTADLTPRAQAQVAPAWAPVSADSARRILGADLVAIPGLPVRRIRVSALGDGTILIEQVLDSSTVLRLYERQPMLREAMRTQAGRRKDSAAPQATVADTAAPSRDVGPVHVTLVAPKVTRDSLWRLALMLERWTDADH